MSVNDRKRVAEHPNHIPNKVKAERKYVKKFWKDNYIYKSANNPQKLSAGDVYKLCCLCYPDLNVSFIRFKELSSCEGIRVGRDKYGKVESYYANPLTDLASSFHGINEGKRSLSLSILNVQGLISQKQNKTDALCHMMGLNSPGKICLMTETHLHAKTHLNSEITKFAHDYHITRADRNREYNLN